MATAALPLMAARVGHAASECRESFELLQTHLKVFCAFHCSDVGIHFQGGGCIPVWIATKNPLAGNDDTISVATAVGQSRFLQSLRIKSFLNFIERSRRFPLQQVM